MEINKLPTNGLVELKVSSVGTFNSIQFLVLKRKPLGFEEYTIIVFNLSVVKCVLPGGGFLLVSSHSAAC